MDAFNNSGDFSQKNPTLKRIADDVIWQNYTIKDSNYDNPHSDSASKTPLKNADKKSKADEGSAKSFRW